MLYIYCNADIGSIYVRRTMDSIAFPITVLVAIVIFLAKEGLEVFRGIRRRKRQIAAYRCMLSDEIEKNHWVVI